ncbi:MAG TPA: amino acid adenylation domain-containing protein, partial [Longimicrobiaceae bacterium]|nr:amino acid adenylation domain-containing protein [Longimicrobiaceae bacterium]
SGSTGTPKGVLVEHHSLAATFAAAQRAFGFGPGDTMAVLASGAFDIWLFEALLPLTRGARVRMVAAERVADVEALAGELADATMMHAVPALMRQLVEHVAEGGRALPALRTCFVGGDAVPPELPARMRAAFPGAGVRVLYGPTEGAVVCASVQAGEAEEHRRLVGRPLGNASLYVCDARGGLLPAGVPGELCLGGASVARGYLGRPALTAERWVPDPFGGERGARLYRTGDRVRWGADGVLEFLGRTDAQVKVRGFRIEPGEVEAALAAHPAVREAAVVLRELPGGPALVAYCVPASEDGSPFSPPPCGEGPGEGVLSWLRARLPDYMVPSALVALDALPLTPTGKLDRAALPSPQGAAEGGYVAPRNPVEELLAGAWAAVLGVERVGARDDFFALGGHSLLATRLISRVREALGVELPLRALFEAPTVAGLAARVEALRRGGAATQAPPLVPLPRDGRPLPLSFAQQRLWFLDRMEPGSAAYNMPAALRIRGPLDAEALRRSLEGVVRRHEALRTVFRASGGEPAQVVLDPAPFPLETVDLRARPEGEREAELLRRAREEAARPFDLAEGPLIRATLLRLGEEDEALLFTMHHVVSDGWSIDLLVGEVGAFYDALTRGAEPELPELPVQYADYAAWQREWLRGDVLDAQIAYWKGRLAGAPPVLELPTDRRRPAVPSARGAAVGFALPPGAARTLRALSRREGATLFMTLFAGWQALLGRYAGEEDVVSGTAVAGRTRRETEGLIGFFVNTLALRTDLSGDPTVGELLGRVRETVLEAHAHQELPFERLVEELGVRRDLAHTPLFQVVFTLQDAGAGPALRLGGASAEPLAVGTEAVKFDLALSMADEGERLTGRLEYRADLFEAETARRMTGHLAGLLEAMAADPDRRLSEMEWVPPAERRLVVEEWNATARPIPEETVHALFAEQAARTPAAVALVGPAGERLTYAELDAAANRLANALRRRGVGPETRVGIFMERSVERVTAMLAVLKAGGTYVPLDPAYPPERLAYLAADSGVRVVLAQERLRELVPPGAPETVFVDADRDAVERESALPPAGPTALGPQQLAYVIYTSGSTGTPKGAAVPHRAVVRLVRGADYVRLDAGETLAQITAAGFDVATFEVWGALLNGARLVVPPPGVPSVARLEELVAREGVTTLWLTSGLFHLVADERPRALAGVRQLLAGGDVLSPDHVRRVLEALPGVRLVNGYGPTENTTFTTCHAVRAEDPGRASIPIGRPISNTRAYVLDAAMRPTPVGVPGELYAGGAGLARGYLDRPDATAEKWVPDPLGPEPGGRLYRTGDRARWLADGTLEFLGRLDQQVKIRGFRIEPGEVEAALHAHPAVRDAAVVVREDAPGDRRLVAYVVAADGGAPPAEELRGHLQGRLPEYMLPAAFVALDALPLTPNGKLDRRALPAPEGGPAREYVAPRTPTETALAALWAELLRVERVGTGDNFFDLGGHSLLLVQLHARLQERWGDGVSITDLFQFSTLGDLARHLDRPREAPADAHRENLERAESRRTGLQRQRAARAGARGRDGS